MASNQYASVSGGQSNTASTYAASVSGGYSNTASGLGSSVSGGQFNTAAGANLSGVFDATSVSGGYSNTASGDYASVSGGRNRNRRPPTGGQRAASTAGRLTPTMSVTSARPSSHPDASARTRRARLSHSRHLVDEKEPPV